MSNPPNIVISKLELQWLDKILDPMKYSLDSLETLENEIARARIVSHTRIPANVVTMNSKVHVLDETTGRDFFSRWFIPWMRATLKQFQFLRQWAWRFLVSRQDTVSNGRRRNAGH
ncbi:MAG: hypothetical protein ACJAXR_003114 [Halopseudomonas sp.]|jgi:hypothetical protein